MRYSLRRTISTAHSVAPRASLGNSTGDFLFLNGSLDREGHSRST